MKRKPGMRLICLLLSVILVVGLIPTTVLAAETSANRFILVAESKSGLIIAPTYVSHAGGTTTVLEALGSSGYSFTGLEHGMVTAIEGVSGSFSRSDEDGNYEFTKYAANVSHYCFSERPSSESKPHEGLLLLMTAMADYLEEPSDVQEAAKRQYQDAKKLFVGISNEAAKTLAKELNDAVTTYKAIQDGETYPVRFTDGTKAYSPADYPGVVITAVNQYGKQWTDTDGDGSLALPFGTYTFSVVWNGLSVSGSVESSRVQEITAVLQEQQWLTEFRLSGNYNEDDFKAGEFAVADWVDRKVTVPVFDSFSGGVYTYAQYNQELTDEIPQLTAIYTMKNETSTFMEKQLTFGSWVSKADCVLKKGSEGNTVVYRVSSEGEDGYTYAQDYTVDFVRIPTLTAITVVDQDGTDQAATTAFDSETAEYTYKVLNAVKNVTVSAVPLESEYEIQINGRKAENGNGEVTISGETNISVTVSANGYSNTYTLKIQPGKGQTQIFSSMKEVTLRVVNSNGVEIPYTAYKETDNSNRYRFTLVPGETYHYVATYDTYYHMADQFTLNQNDGSIISVDFGEVQDWLTELAFGAAGSSVQKYSIPLKEEFTPEKHRYQAELVDTEHLVFAWASAVDMEMSIEAMYQQTFASSLYHGKPYTVELKSMQSTGTQIKRLLMDENPIENSVTIRLTKEVDGVTWYQDYIVDFRRTLTLKKLSADCDGVSTVLMRNEQDTGFVPGVKEYSVKVSMAAQKLTLDLTSYTENRCFGEEQVGYQVTVKEKDKETVFAEAGQAVIELDNTVETQTVSITVENPKSPTGTAVYTVKILKAPPVETTFAYFPQSALLNLREVLSGERLWPDENGTVQLCEGYSYDYVLTAYGYVSKAGRLTVTQNQDQKLVILDGEKEEPVSTDGDHGAARITWKLDAVEPNEEIDTSIPSSWPDFRGNSSKNNYSNNAITDAKVPASAETGTLYWANQIGSGIDADAVGSPVLVDGDIITYASDNLFRIDTLTGEILATGKMDHKSSFSITPPTYAEGMVFVALSNGCVQAFNAATLESLWIYNDPLGGQPNCPLTVKDGYLYTGFWNSETGNANFVCLSVTDEKPHESKEEKHASWFYTAKGGFYWAGAYVSDDFVLVGTDDGTNTSNGQSSRLLLLDAYSGRLLDSWDGLNGDIRSTIVYDNGAYYFTSKGGTFYCVQVSSSRTLVNGWYVNLQNGVGGLPMSTSSPVVHNGRAYVGVSGAGQFSAYSGHNLTVIDINSKTIAYTVPTQGFPQTSGLLTTAYEADSGYAYVYFFDNQTPGKLRVLRDKPGMTGPDYLTSEGSQNVAYALFTPTGKHAQYAICSPIADEYGTVYFKNDSAHLMAFGSAVKELSVTKQPAKTEYFIGETFDPSGMEITAVYANGKTRIVTEYVTFSKEPLTAGAEPDTIDVTISYPYGLYRNQESGQKMLSGVPTPTPTVNLRLSIRTGLLGDVDKSGEINALDVQMILDYEAKRLNQELTLTVADVSGDGMIDSNDAVLISQYLEGTITTFPAAETTSAQ